MHKLIQDVKDMIAHYQRNLTSSEWLRDHNQFEKVSETAKLACYVMFLERLERLERLEGAN